MINIVAFSATLFFKHTNVKKYFQFSVAYKNSSISNIKLFFKHTNVKFLLS